MNLEMNKNATEEKEQKESKIPKFSTAKGKVSKALMEKKTTESCQTNVTIYSEKTKQTQVTRIQNTQQISLVKISKDVMNHLQTENLKLKDHTAECSTPILVQDKESVSKRVHLKEKSSQISQKYSGSLQMKPSTLDFKKGTAHGGIQFVVKRSNCQKPDLFQKLKEELKTDSQDIHVTAPFSKGIKTIGPSNPIQNKDIEKLKIGSLKIAPTNETKSEKAATTILKENVIKKTIKYQDSGFVPKWISTPLKSDLIENINETCSNDDSPLEGLEKTPEFSKMFVKEKIDDKTVLQDKAAAAKEAESLTNNEMDYKTCSAFTGMRLKPKRKSTLEADIFANVPKESHADNQKLHHSGTSTENMKMSSKATKSMTKTQQSRVEKLKQASTRMTGSSETITITTKKVVSKPVQTFAGLRLKPRQKNLPDVFEDQKSKIDAHS